MSWDNVALHPNLNTSNLLLTVYQLSSSQYNCTYAPDYEMRHWLAGWHSISDDIQSFRTEPPSISHIRGSLIHFRLLIAASSTPHVTQNNWQIISATAQFPVFDFSRGLTDNLSLLLPISSASHSLSRLHRVINEVPFQMRSSLRQPQKDPSRSWEGP